MMDRLKRGHSSGRLMRGFMVGALASVLAILFWKSGIYDEFEFRTWDWRARITAQLVPVSEKIAIVYIDEYSIRWVRNQYGVSWPWPREVYAHITSYFDRAGVKSLTIDLIFSDHSMAGVEDDELFAEAIKKHGRVVASAFLGQERGTSEEWLNDLPEPAFNLSVDDEDRFIKRFADKSFMALFPVTEIAMAGGLIGNVNMLPDADGVYRRSSLFSEFDGRLVPPLGIAAYLLGAIENERIISEDRKPLIMGRRVPLDREGRLLLRFPDRGAFRLFNAAEIIESEVQYINGVEDLSVPTEQFRDKYVFIGASAVGLLDLRPTPMDSNAPGVNFHAAMLNNFLSGAFMRDLSKPVAILFSIFLVLITAIIGAYISGAYRFVLLYIVFLPLPIILTTLLFAMGISAPLFPSLTGIAMALVISNVVQYSLEGRQKRFIRNAFRQYLSPAVIDSLIANPGKLQLGGEKRELSIFFSDLEGFTTISEGLSPEELTSLLNEYLSAMTDIIHEEGGTIDKYEGDAIIAFWNAPLLQEDHADRALRAAMKCQSVLEKIRPALKQKYGPELFMRVGLNTGFAVVGNMGSRTRFDYTMIGDSVNLAARIEGINKMFGTYTLLSGAMAEKLKSEFFMREISRVAVKGRAEPVTLFEPLEKEKFISRQPFYSAFSNALNFFYEGRMEDARKLFSELAENDPVSESYYRYIDEIDKNDPDEWKGVLVMKSK